MLLDLWWFLERFYKIRSVCLTFSLLVLPTVHSAVWKFSSNWSIGVERCLKSTWSCVWQLNFLRNIFFPEMVHKWAINTIFWSFWKIWSFFFPHLVSNESLYLLPCSYTKWRLLVLVKAFNVFLITVDWNIQKSFSKN